MSDLPLTIELGTRLGPYEILSLIGAGGMGEVYRARDTRLGREVAIKVLPAQFSNDAGRLHRFEQEARAAGMLNHANLLGVYDIGSHDGAPYVVTELLEGRTLRDRLEPAPPPLRKALDWALQMVHGVAAAHQKGIIHRDLKPENIFVTNDGRVKILDFGLAKLSQGGLASLTAGSTVGFRTEPGFVLGTFGYMAPEQVRGQQADARSDIFALGLVLYEMVAGRRAFAEDSTVETMNAILKEEPPDLATCGRPVPPGLVRVVRHCLEKDPDDRFQTAHDLGFALEALTGLVEPVPVGVERRSWAVSKRIQAAAALVAAVLCGMALSAWVLRPRPVDPPTFRYLTYSGRDYSPSASASGRFIAFTSERDGTPRIWMKELTGGDERPLTSGPDDLARFSPLGSMLLFTRSEGGHTSLYRVGVLGGTPRKIVDNAVEGDWSPDGKQIAFLRSKNVNGQATSEIGVVSANGENERQIALHDQKLAHVRWSPDGSGIAAVEVSQSGLQHPIFWTSADGKEQRALATPRPGFALSSLAWLDSEEIVYFQNESALQGGLGVNAGTANIIRQNIRTGETERISWSPDSTTVLDLLGPGRIVYDTCSPRASLREFRTVSLAAPHWLTRGNSNDRQPSYSPDSEWLVFSSNRAGNLDLWSMSLKTEVVRRVTEDDAEDWDPTFAADGKSVLWSSNRGGHFEIWKAAPDGSGARQITHDGVDAENPSPSPNGRWIVYASGHPQKVGLWKVRPEGTGAVRLVAGSFAFPEVSPDGRYVLYSSNYMTERVSLQVVELETGTKVPFEIRIGAPTAKLAFALGRAKWMPSGRSIAFIGQNERGVNGIFTQDFAPGQDTTASRRALAGFDDERTTESFGISPDGSRLAIASWDQMFSLMLAERVPSVSPRRIR